MNFTKAPSQYINVYHTTRMLHRMYTTYQQSHKLQVYIAALTERPSSNWFETLSSIFHYISFFICNRHKPLSSLRNPWSSFDHQFCSRYYVGTRYTNHNCILFRGLFCSAGKREETRIKNNNRERLRIQSLKVAFDEVNDLLCKYYGSKPKVSFYNAAL